MQRLNEYPFQGFLGYYWENKRGELFVGSKTHVEYPISEKKTDSIIQRTLKACSYLYSKKNKK